MRTTAMTRRRTAAGRIVDWRAGVLAGTALAGAAALATRPAIPQDLRYLVFADGRTMLGVPNACNVLSNLAFAAVGAAGLALLASGRVALRDRRERAPWRAFFAAVALTSLGSAAFHLAPSIGTLVWDRLPMAVGFMALLAALVAERVDVAAGRRLLWPLVLAGLASVVTWWASEQAGAGDLRPYLFVQYYPLVAVPLVLLLYPAAYTGSAGWLLALAAYLLAKIAEVEDARVFASARVVSGHTVKHLAAAVGIGLLAAMLARRRPIEDARAAAVTARAAPAGSRRPASGRTGAGPRTPARTSGARRSARA
jgi:hypothetical protein